MRHSIELLAPAGDLNRLKTAVRYGADAVYIGGKELSLRSRAGNFSCCFCESIWGKSICNCEYDSS